MAVKVNGGKEIEYEGCVLRTWEHNDVWDSDFYAEVWDEAEQKVKNIEYDTTRCGGSGYADADITEENLHKVYRYYYRAARSSFDHHGNEEQAKKVRKGDIVVAIKGRKIKKGTQGRVFWVGTKYNPYSRMNEERVGLEIDGERVFTALENVEPVNWQDRLITGKKRKAIIRERALANTGYTNYLER